MRLANGIIIDKEKTFGVLKFSALRREVHMQNEDGTVSEEIKERMILSILVYTFFSRMFDLMLPPVAKHSIVVA